jgi:LCP family protein required for cell wall assembly
MVLRLDPKSAKASLLSLPRDLWVDIPGHGQAKLNAAYAYGNTADPDGGGQRLLIETIKQNFQIPINHFVQVNWDGFRSIISSVGGVKAYFPTQVRDKMSGLAVETPGCVTLDADQALAYARSRHYEVFNPETGKWINDPNSDLTRNRRQQDLIRRVMRRAIAQGARNPFKLKEFVDAGIKSVTLDDQLTINNVLGLGQRYRGFDPSELVTSNLQVIGGWEGGQQVLTLQETPKNRNMLAIFQGTAGDASDDSSTTSGPQSPGEVKVTVLNGSGVPNQATQVTQALTAAGFRTGLPGDSPMQVAQTTVQYPAGQAGAAQLVARYLAAGAALQQSPDVKEITVLSGPDYTSVLRKPKAASEVPLPTTSTTSTTTTAPTTAPTTTTTSPNTIGKTGVDPYNPDTFVAPAPPAGTPCS